MQHTVQPSAIKQALTVLREGGLILYPTDTIWGIGCDATNTEAVEKVHQLKGRNLEKSFIILLSSESQLQSYVEEIPEVAYQLIEYADKPLTIVYSSAKNIAPNAVAADGSIGIRIVKHPFCEQLLQRFRKPILSTSANISGQPSPTTYAEISPEIIQGVDYVTQYGREFQEAAKPSTIIKLDTGGKFTFIRK